MPYCSMVAISSATKIPFRTFLRRLKKNLNLKSESRPYLHLTAHAPVQDLINSIDGESKYDPGDDDGEPDQ